jgi:hypothetical protein
MSARILPCPVRPCQFQPAPGASPAPDGGWRPSASAALRAAVCGGRPLGWGARLRAASFPASATPRKEMAMNAPWTVRAAPLVLPALLLAGCGGVRPAAGPSRIPIPSACRRRPSRPAGATSGPSPPPSAALRIRVWRVSGRWFSRCRPHRRNCPVCNWFTDARPQAARAGQAWWCCPGPRAYPSGGIRYPCADAALVHPPGCLPGQPPTSRES